MNHPFWGTPIYGNSPKWMTDSELPLWRNSSSRLQTRAVFFQRPTLSSKNTEWSNMTCLQHVGVCTILCESPFPIGVWKSCLSKWESSCSMATKKVVYLFYPMFKRKYRETQDENSIWSQMLRALAWRIRYHWNDQFGDAKMGPQIIQMVMSWGLPPVIIHF